MHSLDLDTLRSFVLIAEGKSLAEIAEQAGQTPAAISLQMKRLEKVVGTTLLIKDGRKLQLGSDGLRFMAYARRLLDLQNETLAAFRRGNRRSLHFGVIQDFSDVLLSKVLARFREQEPDVDYHVKINRTQLLLEGVESGQLEFCIGVDKSSALYRRPVASAPMIWIGSERRNVAEAQAQNCLPLVMLEQPCSFRETAVNALAASGRDSEIVLSTPSLQDLKTAVANGMGLTVRTPGFAKAPLKTVSLQLPRLPRVQFSAYSRESKQVPLQARLVDEFKAEFALMQREVSHAA